MNARTARQLVFNQVWEHFIVNDAPFSFVEDEEGSGRCMYRSDDGSRCAVGLLLSDEEYDPFFEGKSVTDSAVFSHLPERIVVCGDLFLAELQRAHDSNVGSKEEMREDLLALAPRYSLIVPTSPHP